MPSSFLYIHTNHQFPFDSYFYGLPIRKQYESFIQFSTKFPTVSRQHHGQDEPMTVADPEDITKKHHKLCYGLMQNIRQEKPKNYPFPNTSDMQVEAITELEEEVENTQKLLDKVKSQLSSINDDISYLENKKLGLEKMKEAYLNATEIKAGTTYAKEFVITKRVFRSVKNDLHAVVDLLFPQNQEFQNFLADLLRASNKGGDDLYIDVTPEVLNFVNFLIEADIAMYYKNDKTKIRLTDML